MSKGVRERIAEIKNKIKNMEQPTIRIAIFGQPGAGKSSLVNSIIGEEQAAVSVQTDVTTSLNTYHYDNLVIGDFPGYGTEQFPADSYLERFGVLDYDIFLCVFNNKLHNADIKFFRQLNKDGRIILLVRTYADGLWQPDKSAPELRAEILSDVCEQLGGRPQLFFVSNIDGTGIEELLHSVQALIEPAKRDAFIRSVRAESEQMLAEKYTASEALITNYCRLAALNGINPIPGLDIALDMSLLFKMFADIRRIYGLSESRLNKAAAVLPLAKQIMVYGTEWGLMALLKNIGKRVAIGKAVKYIPLVGQAVAATLGYLIVKKAGLQYLQDCKHLASELLKSELESDK